MCPSPFIIRDGTLITYTGRDADVILPDCVVHIGDQAFYHNESLRSVQLHPGVRSVGQSAFSQCKALEHLYAPDGLAYIAQGAFAGCEALCEAPLPDSVCFIGEEAFLHCAALTSVRIPQGVSVLEARTFWRCTSLAYLFIPQGVQSISEDAFGCCPLGNIEVSPENPVFCSVDGALYDKEITTLLLYPKGDKKEDITLPASVISIPRLAFSDMKTLLRITLPDGLQMLPTAAFSECGALCKVHLGSALRHIEDSAFSGCTSLTTLTLPHALECIENRAFARCGLSSILLPASVNDIGKGIFEGCRALETIDTEEANAFFSSKGGNLYTKDGKGFVLYAPGKPEMVFSVPSGVQWVASHAFYECASLCEIRLPDTAEYLASHAFSRCAALQCVRSDKPVIRHRRGTLFDACGTEEKPPVLQAPPHSNGTSAVLAGELIIDGVTLRPSHCDQDTVFPVGIRRIGEEALFENNELEALLLPASVTEIGRSAFCDSHTLECIKLPNTLQSIGYAAFGGCIRLREVMLPENVCRIDTFAFAHCDALKHIHVDSANRCFTATRDGLLLGEGGRRVLFCPIYPDTDEIEVPHGVTVLEKNLFRNTHVSKLRLPDTLLTLRSGSLLSPHIKEINLPAALCEIETDWSDSVRAQAVFGRGISQIHLSPDNKQFFLRDGILYADGGKTLLFCLPSDKETEYIIPEGVTSIAPFAFEYREELKRITLPHSLRRIGQRAFAYSGITEIELPEGITSLPREVFCRCRELRRITLPTTLRRIGDSAFGMCSSLQAIKLPEGLACIADFAFRLCIALEGITLPDSLFAVEGSAFHMCRALQAASIGRETVINAKAFPPGTAVLRRT